MSRKRSGFRYSSPEPQPERPLGRAWLSPDWQQPGPPKIPHSVGFGPDYMGDLPVWGVDWQNPPFSRELFQALVDWQDEFDDHGMEQWPAAEWSAWQAEVKDYCHGSNVNWGPQVTIAATFRASSEEKSG